MQDNLHMLENKNQTAMVCYLILGAAISKSLLQLYKKSVQLITKLQHYGITTLRLYTTV